MSDRRTARLARSAAGRRYLERKAERQQIVADMTADTPEHGTDCPRPLADDCLQFSTDGTRLGAYIAHQMGTTSEEAIIADALERERREREENLTGMDEEEADWNCECPYTCEVHDEQ